MTIRSLIFVALFALFHLAAHADDAPAWLKQAAAAGVPGYEKSTPAVVLRDEQSVSLGTDGKLVTTENFAVRMLNSEGRHSAVARAFYLVSSGKIRDIQAWVIRPDGNVREYDKKSVLDLIADPDDVYNEGRMKIIDASRDIDVGHVFGYTIVSEDLPLFYQDSFTFQGRLPAIVSRYSLNLPQGWAASSITFNTADIKPSISGTTYTWEMRDLPPIPIEPLSPSVANLAARISVNYAPENNYQTVNRAFADWLDVSRWASSVYDPQVVINDEIAIKARELTANAKSEIEKIRAIGTYVQNLQYISIDIGVGHGNGYKPRLSSLVLARGYGDCKDKANLMRALLKVLSIDAYPIAIYSGDAAFVREEWASPRQFNHCIIAVKVSEATNAPTVMTHAKLGRLLIFDATDAFTPVGDLPDYLQGSKALIIAGENGGLATMPVTPPETDLLEREVEINIAETGNVTGKIREVANGQTSTAFRREMRELSSSEYQKAIEGWLTRGATGARLVNVKPTDKQSEASFHLDVEFAADRYGQLMQNKLLVFKPVIVGRRRAISLTDPKRTNPIEIDSTAMKETVVFTLPAGFAVDELPEPISLETQFGQYKTSYEAKEGKLYFSRSMTMRRSTIAPDKYNSVKDFFAKMLEADQSAVVLIRK
jgi:transglutaminase-like putative cysteine protease